MKIQNVVIEFVVIGIFLFRLSYVCNLLTNHRLISETVIKNINAIDINNICYFCSSNGVTNILFY